MVMAKICAINKKILLPLITAGSLTLTACQTPFAKAKEYCKENDKTQLEYLEVCKTREGCQARLDSMVYRDLFNQTYLVEDSASVAEFNNTKDRKEFIQLFIEDINGFT